MRKLFLLALLASPFLLNAQQIPQNWDYNGVNREYLLYVPNSYDGSEAVPVVFCLHGLGDNMNNFAGIGMNYVADTANFIVVTPQALVDGLSGSTAWNSGASYLGFTLNGSVNDVGFLSAIIDSLDVQYNIDLKRVYSCGFSMGGFMTNRLGCEMNDRIAAIASVAGTIGGALNCNPGRAVPAAHFHGTSDATVAYSGNQYGNDAEDLANFWATNNNCGTSPIVTNLPDIASDNYLITHSLYSGCDDGADVELFKVDSADHVWLTPVNDIFYTTEIWNFLSRHTNSTKVSVNETLKLDISTYPNPTQGELNISIPESGLMEVKVFDIVGNVVFTAIEYQSGSLLTLDLQNFENGNYIVQVKLSGKIAQEKISIFR